MDFHDDNVEYRTNISASVLLSRVFYPKQNTEKNA